MTLAIVKSEYVEQVKVSFKPLLPFGQNNGRGRSTPHPRESGGSHLHSFPDEPSRGASFVTPNGTSSIRYYTYLGIFFLIALYVVHPE
jgi:hypothetical protein